MSKLCGRCDFPTAPTQRIRSKFTSTVYCSDVDSCARRARNELSLEEMSVLTNRNLAQL